MEGIVGFQTDRHTYTHLCAHSRFAQLMIFIFVVKEYSVFCIDFIIFIIIFLMILFYSHKIFFKVEAQEYLFQMFLKHLWELGIGLDIAD